MKIENLRKILLSKGLIDVVDTWLNKYATNDFIYIINKYGYTKILYNYSIPFIIGNKYPDGVNVTNFLSSQYNWSYQFNTTFNKIYNFFEFDVWFGNYITEILHDAENVLKGAFKNLLTESLNMDDKFTFSFDRNNNQDNIKFLLILWNISETDLGNQENDIYLNNRLLSGLYDNVFKIEYYFNRHDKWNDKLKKYSIIEWIDTMSFGTFVTLLRIFNEHNPTAFKKMIRLYFRTMSVIEWTNNTFRFTNDPKLFLYFYSCIVDLRNAISHNNVIYNYKFFNPNSFKRYFSNPLEAKNAIVKFLKYMNRYRTVTPDRYKNNLLNDVNISYSPGYLEGMELDSLIKEAQKYTTYVGTKFIIQLLKANLQTNRKKRHFKVILSTIDENIEILFNSLKDQPTSISDYIFKKMFSI